MAEVVVVGAGLGGLATAARLAKLGHSVTVLERGHAPGGLLAVVRQDGFCWDATPFQTTVPAVLRDLFRKSGRPIERYVDLRLSAPARRHVFTDGTTLDLPTGSRAAQLREVGQALGDDAGRAWTAFVDGLADPWALLRAEVLDRPDGAARLADRKLGRALRTHQPLDRVLRKAFRDPRLRQLASYPAQRDNGTGSPPQATRAVDAYVERTFGVWRLASGAQELADALLTRLRERSVEVRFGAEAVALRTRGDRVRGVELADGSDLAADWVVSGPHDVHRRDVTHLGLREDAAPSVDLPAELVLHGDPTVVITTGDTAPSGLRACSVTVHGDRTGDALGLLADRGIDLRESVVTRPETRPTLSTSAPSLEDGVPGHVRRGHARVMGSGVPYVAWEAAHVATLVGKADSGRP